MNRSNETNLLSRAPLMDRLPPVRGRLVPDAPLAGLTWFRVGGPAEVLFKPADLQDLQDFLHVCPKDVSVLPIGVASNLLVRDGGVPGVVVRLGAPFAGVTVDGDRIHAGAAALDGSVAMAAQEAGLGGLEFLIGIPGTIGGGFRTNAGCYGREMKDIVVQARAVDRNGMLHVLTPATMDLSYRHCGLPADWIFVDAVLQGTPETREIVAERMAKIRRMRGDSAQGSVGTARTGGSTFANPGGPTATGTDPQLGRAWELVDKAGCRGRRRGDAQISDVHANFLVNTGNATAADLEELGEEVRRLVKEKTGADLRWEIQRIGKG